MLAFLVCHVIGKLKNASCFELRMNPTMADVLPSCYEALPVSPVDPLDTCISRTKWNDLWWPMQPADHLSKWNSAVMSVTDLAIVLCNILF
jgi:hypothetical protein